MLYCSLESRCLHFPIQISSLLHYSLQLSCSHRIPFCVVCPDYHNTTAKDIKLHFRRPNFGILTDLSMSAAFCWRDEDSDMRSTVVLWANVSCQIFATLFMSCCVCSSLPRLFPLSKIRMFAVLADGQADLMQKKKNVPFQQHWASTYFHWISGSTTKSQALHLQVGELVSVILQQLGDCALRLRHRMTETRGVFASSCFGLTKATSIAMPKSSSISNAHGIRLDLQLCAGYLKVLRHGPTTGFVAKASVLLSSTRACGSTDLAHTKRTVKEYPEHWLADRIGRYVTRRSGRKFPVAYPSFNSSTSLSQLDR